MNAISRRIVVGSAVVTLALTMAACGKAGDDNKKSDSSTSSSSNNNSAAGKSIGLLLPDTVTARYEKFDRPLITQKIKELYYVGDDGTVAGRKAVMGALSLYLDFVNLFLMLLRLMGNNRS